MRTRRIAKEWSGEVEKWRREWRGEWVEWIITWGGTY
jgi:hypothetical protein